MADITSIVDYYTNLLIIQYNQKPKAMATIRALITEMQANGIILDIGEAFNVDTAVGVQLDIIGKYVGIDRYFTTIDLENYFAFTDYDEVNPDLDLKYGFSDYTTFDSDNLNGTATYDVIVSAANALNDDDFRKLIRLKILQNNSNHSHKSIDDGIWEIFGSDVVPSSSGSMTMSYTVNRNVLDLINIAFEKGALPRPMGVGINIITASDVPFFAFATYEGTPTMIAGFQTYENYGTVPGEFLTYDELT